MSQYIFGRKNWGKKIFGPQVLCQKKLSASTNLSPKFLRPKRLFGDKILVQDNLGPKIVWSKWNCLKNDRSKKKSNIFFGQTNRLTKKIPRLIKIGLVSAEIFHLLKLGRMLHGQMLPWQMSPRHLSTHTHGLTNQSLKSGQVWTSNNRDMASYLLIIYSVGNNLEVWGALVRQAKLLSILCSSKLLGC